MRIKLYTIIPSGANNNDTVKFYFRTGALSRIETTLNATFGPSTGTSTGTFTGGTVDANTLTSQNIQTGGLLASTLGSDVSAVSNIYVTDMSLNGTLTLNNSTILSIDSSSNKPVIGSSQTPIGSVYADDIFMTSLNTFKIVDVSADGTVTELGSIRGKSDGGLIMSSLTTQVWM